MLPINTQLKLPGLLTNPNRVLKEDERVDPALLAALAPYGFDGPQQGVEIHHTAPLADRIAFVTEAEPGFDQLMNAIYGGVAPVKGIERSTVVIRAQDNNDINLYISKPANSTNTLPCILYMHGGGMAVLSAQTRGYSDWRDLLCAQGLVVIGVEFRNAAGSLGPHPYPAGLNDCMSALEWVNDNKQKLAISNIVVAGESGGGNLCLAMTLRAKQENKLGLIQGTYALCPYIYGDYGNKTPDLPSLYENDGYFNVANTIAVLASVYDPDNTPQQNPLAWPYWADVKMLEGLPPHVISVQELDLLRDEGLAYYRKLRKAGVNAYSRTVMGITHSAEVVFADVIKEIAQSTLRDIKGFAMSL